jgi:uridylate kinase
MINIVKFGGSIVNPNGKYDNVVINHFIQLVKEKITKAQDKFIFVVGGGKLCRKIQEASKPFLQEALNEPEAVQRANDWLGISTTKINAEYVLKQFQKKLGKTVEPQLILDPTRKVKSNCKVFFTSGWVPGCSTDKDMMLLAKTFNASKVFKISDFEIVKKIKPLELAKALPEKKAEILAYAPEIKQMTWKELVNLVGTTWVPGLSTPFDPEAAALGYTLRKKLTVYIGRKEQFPKMVRGERFRGTVVKG